jgi:uncharacterized delta-60 repeat protein
MSAKIKVTSIPDYVAAGLNVGGSVPFSLSYSSDGITWTPSTLPAGSSGFGDVIFGEDRFVAITANNSSEAAYSTDGITWTATTLPSAGNWNSLSYGGGKFVAIRSSSNVAAYSIDGITWTATTLPATASWLSVTYGDGKFVAIARYSFTSAYSTDGITWIAGTMPTEQSWQQVAYGEGKFVALINDSVNFAYSTNGSTWTLGSMPYSYENWNQIAYGDGKFVALINNSSKSAYSLDGVSWTASNMPSSQSWGAITYGDGKFVALAYGSTTTAYSTDGITWTTSTITAAAGWVSIAYGNEPLKKMVAPYIKVSGIWKIAKSAYIKVAGAWRSWFLQGGVVDELFSQKMSSYTFDSSSPVLWDVGVQSNGRIIIFGDWYSPAISRGYVGGLNPDGSFDLTYGTSGSGISNGSTLLVLPDNSALFGKRLANPLIEKRTATGAIDSAFRTNIGAGFTGGTPQIHKMAVTSSNKIVAVGNFSAFKGTSANNIVQLNSDGTLDTSFHSNIGSGANGEIKSCLVQPNGKILLGGSFTSFNGTAADKIIRLNSDGTRDTEFAPSVGYSSGYGVVDLAIQKNQKIIVATQGNFVTRLNSSGTLDSSFSSTDQGVGTIFGIKIFEDDKILVFGQPLGIFKGVAKLNSNGTPDVTFRSNVGTGVAWPGTPNASGAVIEKNGDVILGGRILSFNGISNKLAVRIGGGSTS